MEGLTKKQEIEFERIHAASFLLLNEFGLDEVAEASQANLLRIQAMRIKRGSEILGDSPIFGSTKEIVKYVKENY